VPTSIAATTITPASTITSALLPLTPSVQADSIRYEDRLISRRALSQWFGVSVHRLAVWAIQGFGPKPIRIGGYKIAYRLGDCLDHLRAQSADICRDVRKTKNQKPGNLSQV
jgi:hypothetical protein